jgi:putative peptide zinc metalloprotease protein
MTHDHASGRTYSDAWHRVASVRPRLRSSVRAHRQQFRGEAWVVLRDSLSADHFRITTEAWQFISQLDGQRTVDALWTDLMTRGAEQALTQEEVVQLLGHMHMANLLQFDQGDAAASLFERYQKRRGRERLALWMGILSIKIPLLDPDRALERALPLIRWVFGPWGMLAYLTLLLFAGKALLEHSDELWRQGEGMLSPGNLGLLYVGMVLAKTVHEFGHAAACKRYGGEVHKMGVMLLIFAPLPYMDATASWGFRSRMERLLVGASGVLSELAVAAIAALVWANTAPGPLNALAHNVMFVASVSTLLFNLNPLLRFDGYHILVDALDVPNLYQRSREQLKYLGERWVLRLPHAQPAARSVAESWWLPLYGVVSLAYWVVLMSGIVFFVAKQYLVLGQLLAVFLLVTGLGVPLFKFLRYLASSPRLAHQRSASVLRVGVWGGLLLAALTVVPIPDRVRVDGVMQARESRSLFNESAGLLAERLATPGAWVVAGQPLLRLVNAELDFELEGLRQQRAQLLAQELQAIHEQVANLAPLQQQRWAVEEQILERERQQHTLLVRAPIEGRWSAPELDVAQGQWLARGAPLGTVVDERQWRFVAVLPQVATHIFKAGFEQAEVRLRGQEQHNLWALQAEVLPFEQGLLPSAALGMSGGGDIAVDPQDPYGLKAAEPFFRVQAELPLEAMAGPVWHGQRGVMRLTLPAAPLAQQWERALRQFLQREFRV